MSDNLSIEQKQRELQALKAKVAALEDDLAVDQIPPDWTPKTFYSGKDKKRSSKRKKKK